MSYNKVISLKSARQERVNSVNVVWTSIERFSNVMDVRWTLKQRCGVLTGL